MTLVQFLRLVARHFKLMLLTGLLAALTTFWMTRDAKKEYQSYSIVNTGLVTGYNIESSQGGRIDYAYTNNEIENIIGLARSRETLEELGVRLLAQALMLDQPNPDILSAASMADLKKVIPADVRANVVAAGDLEKTVLNIRAQLDRDDPNPVKHLLESEHPLFGIEHLQTIVVKREGTSDMIRIAYTTTDPGVCRNTLASLTELFIAKHRAIKEGQSTSVLEFFEKATKESAGELAGKEDVMLNFMVTNKIINYYEQTRFIAAKKEDLDELYYKEMMQVAAADSSRRELEVKLGNRLNLPAINKSLINQRQGLTTASARLAAVEIGSLTDSVPQPGASAEAAVLRKQIEDMKSGIRHNAEATFAVNRTPEGIESQALLTRWLDQWLTVEQTLARLDVLRDRKIEFDKIYSRFAPWGSRLKRLEREIDVSEHAYLENLHSFNQARLHKHNMLMASNLRVVDAPFFPSKPNASKRAVLVIVAGLAGLILVLAFFIALEFMDNTLHDPERAMEMTGLELATAFPRLPADWKTNAKLDYNYLTDRAAAQLLQRIQLDLRNQPDLKQPPRIAVLSTRKGEGKSKVLEFLQEKCREQGQEYEWIEIPALLQGAYPVDALAGADLAILVANATRNWNVADNRSLAMAGEVLSRPCRLVLNAVQPDNMESALGEIPKKRTMLRRWMKRMALKNYNID
jgi:uncharacterized protein involved in exopolysaccharide biosynthesis